MDSASRRCIQLVLSLVVIVFCASLIWAQGNVTATLTGVIKDQSGATVPGVMITATNEGTGVSRSALSDDAGNYTIPLLPIGMYKVTAELRQFKKQTKTGIKLDIDQKARLDFDLAVGEVTEEVTVEGQASVLKTESPEAGEVIDNKRIVTLPLNGRQFVNLVLTTAGATPPPQGDLGASFALAGGSASINGNRSSENTFLLDGISLTDRTFDALAASPSIDAIQEFKVQASQYSAEFGSAAGAQVNVSLKSGTNAFHGSAWEFLRNDKFDARNFFDLGKPAFRQNQYGGTLGGPIIKGSTFFFVNYEGLKIRKGITVTSAVPSDALRNGDFTGLPTIFDPATYNAATNTAQPFPNNRIPLDRINPAAKSLLQLIPAANLNASVGGRNFSGSGKQSVNSDQFNTRVDRTLSVNDTLFARFTYSKINDLEPIPGLTGAENAPAAPTTPGFGQTTQLHTINTALGYTHVFSPRASNQVRLGFNRTTGAQIQENQADFSTATGIKGNDTRSLDNGVPQFSIAGFSNFGDGTSDLNYVNNTFTLLNDFVYSPGKHTLKAGFSGQQNQHNDRFFNNPRGIFQFRNIFTSDPKNPNATGNAFADFLLGYVNTASAGVGDNAKNLRFYDFAGYLQDDWKIRPNLTLNLGLRYEATTATRERRERLATFDPATGKIVLGTDNGSIPPDAPVSKFTTLGFITDKDAGFPKGLVNTDYNNFAPRIGLAFTPWNKLVVRAGYGIFYTRASNPRGRAQTFNPPYLGSLTFTNAARGNLITVQNALISTQSVTPNVSAVDKNNPTGYVQNWNLSVQHEVTPNFVVEATYLGNKGTKLNMNVPFNLIDLVTKTRPFPNVAATSIIGRPAGTSSYNSLALKAEKRFSRGLTFSANYVFSKSLDLISSGLSNTQNVNRPQNGKNLAAEWGPSVFDIRHRFVINGVYELPFGKGALLGGWAVAGIVTLQGRIPFSPVLTVDQAGDGTTNAQRPDQIGDPNAIDNRTADRYFNTAAFALPAAGRYGTAGRDTVRGPDYKTVDFSTIKNFRLPWEHTLEFRAEFFNLFNRANFNVPNRSFGTATFGQIFTARPPRDIQFSLKYVF